MIPLIYIFASCCFLAYYLWTSAKAAPKPPPYPGALPFFGHAFIFLGSTEHFWKTMKKVFYNCIRQGGMTSLSLGPLKLYVIADPDDCLTISNSCLGKPYAYDFSKSWLGNGLATADVPTWQRHRKLLRPAFSQHTLNGFIEVFNDQAKRLVDQLSPHVGNGPFIPQEYVDTNTLETSTQTALNVKVHQQDFCEKHIEITKSLLAIYASRFMKIWLHTDYIYRWSATKKKEDELLRTNYNLFNKIIQNRKLEIEHNRNSKSDMEQTEDKYKSLLDLMLGCVEENKLTDNDVRDHVNTVVLAAADTTYVTLMFTLLLLGSHIDVQERVYNELVEVLGSSNKDVDKHHIPKLVYLEAVLKESMRVYPVAPFIGRVASTDLTLSTLISKDTTIFNNFKVPEMASLYLHENYTLPAGSICMVSIFGLHRHPAWGADVERFRPGRWLEPAALPDNPSTFAAFSLGRRSCIGKSYGLMSMKITLAHVLRRYKVSADVSKLVLNMDAMLKPKSGHEIVLELRM